MSIIKDILGNLTGDEGVKGIVGAFASQMRGYAKDAGTACSMPGCDALTLGVRCDTCARRVCMTHAFWRLHVPKVVPFCAYCVVQSNPDLFSDDGPDKE